MLRLLLTICAAVTALTATAEARTPYDGQWSVLIVTEKGECDRAYRYPVRIANGVVSYAGDGSFVISGKVRPNGAVSVSIRHGERSAGGSGRLSSGGGGGGRWSGRSSSTTCSGTWSAEKRG